MKKITDDELKSEAARILKQYCPDDLQAGESLEAYQERNMHEALVQLAKKPQAQTPVSVWGQK